MDNLILKIDNISKSFPRVKANKNISFNIRRNTVHALLGENGAGKSTFVKILYGLLKPDEGKMIFNNNVLNVQSPSEARQKKIGMVFQHFSLFESLTVRDNLILGIEENISYSKLQQQLKDIFDNSRFSIDTLEPVDIDDVVAGFDQNQDMTYNGRWGQRTLSINLEYRFGAFQKKKYNISKSAFSADIIQKFMLDEKRNWVSHNFRKKKWPKTQDVKRFFFGK